jgi:hypothetical protein
MDHNFIILNRIGYGSNFNKISIDINKNIIKKECINEYGKKKINYEINFYKFLINNSISFKIPKIYSFQENGYTMEYLNDYEPLYKIYNLIDQKKKNKLITEIRQNLKELHNSSKKIISKDEYYFNLKIEIYEKIHNRYNLIKDIVKKYDFIKTVNNIEILSFEKILSEINNKIYEFIGVFRKLQPRQNLSVLLYPASPLPGQALQGSAESVESKNNSEYYFVPLHGDCQFNNILYNIEKDDFIFIDPRGYYGNYEIYGIPEYDFAKILFALSGYDEFDNREINKLDIFDNNINININFLDKNYFEFNSVGQITQNSLESLLMYNIWLGNAECFIKNNEIKGIYSYFISLYLGTLYLSSFHENIK